MDLQTGELLHFSALMLLPPGNVQAEVEAWRTRLRQDGLLQMEATPPAWLYLGTLSGPEAVLAIDKLSARLLPPLVLDKISVQNGCLYLESTNGWDNLTTVEASMVNLHPAETILPTPNPLQARSGSILLGRLAQDRPSSEVQKLTRPVLRTSSVQIAVVEFQTSSIPGKTLSWRLQQAKYLKLRAK